MLIGRQYTRLSDKLLFQDKEYLATVCLGVSTDTYDSDGKIVARSKKVPDLEEIKTTVARFQGEIEQIPPMFSAKKVKGRKLYELARKGETIERTPAKVWVQTEMLHFAYPNLRLRIVCSKGTYIRSIAYEMGKFIGCGAYLSELQRVRSGSFHLDKCLDGKLLDQSDFDITPHLIHADFS